MKSLSPFQQGFVGGLGALALCALILFGISVLAQDDADYDAAFDVNHDGEIDVLDIQTVAGAWSSVGSPRGTLQVFRTTATYNGLNAPGHGRYGMHEACRQEDPASHFCTIQEIENAWRTTGVSFLSASQMWIDNAIIGTLADGYDGNVIGNSDWIGGSTSSFQPYNCNAWRSSSNDGRGMILNIGAITPANEACDDIHPIACCK